MSRIAELYKKAEKERKEREERERREEEERQARSRAAQERQRRLVEEQRRRAELAQAEAERQLTRLMERSGLQKILDELERELDVRVERRGVSGGVELYIGQVIRYSQPVHYTHFGNPDHGGGRWEELIRDEYDSVTEVIGVKIEVKFKSEEPQIVVHTESSPYRQYFTPENNWKGLAEVLVRELESGIAKKRIVHELRRRKKVRKKILGLF